jgi:hypothetical protein
LTNTAWALKLIETPLPETAVLVAIAHAVGVAVGAPDLVGVGVGGGGPGQMLIAARAKPGEGLAVGQRPAINTPLLLKDPKQVLPLLQLATATPRTNTATGATTSHSFHRNIEH